MQAATLLYVLLCLNLGVKASPDDSPTPCTFPPQCGCSLAKKGTTVLKCKSMQNCFSQEGMDALGASMKSESCPVRKATLGCALGSVWPIIEITSELFRHEQWRSLQELNIGTACSFVFSEPRVLSRLPNLVAFSLQNNNISVDLGRFSDVFCCPKKLSQILLMNLGAEAKGRRLGNRSFVRLTAFTRLTVFNSPKLFDRIDIVLNTSSPSFSFHWHGNLPKVNSNFSSLSFTNLDYRSTLELQISQGTSVKLSLDAPARLRGFNFAKLGIEGTRLASIGSSPFRNFTLKDIAVTGAGLNEKLLPRLLSAIANVKDQLQVTTLTLEFNYKKRGFPYEEFNALCASLPLLRHFLLSHSSVSFADPGRYFDCPQLFLLSLTNCNLQDEDLPPHAFDRLTQLKNLRLIRNKLDTFPRELIRNLSQLTYLDLSRNYRLELRASSLRGIVPSLQTLRLTQTGYVEPLIDAFVDQPNLTELHLNQLRVLVPGPPQCPYGRTWFRNCSKLRVLSLSDDDFFNTGECHGDNFFDPLISIEFLDLGKCRFGIQSDGTVKSLLAKLQTLTTLSLPSNDIARVEFFLSSRMPRLTFLDISTNPFSSFPVDLFASRTPELRELYLMKVPLTNINPATFSRLPDIRIRFGRNQFSCTCDLLPFADWIRQQWPTYQLENKGDWLLDAVCYAASNTTVRLMDFRMSWWDCYSRRLIVLLSSSIGGLLLLFLLVGLLLRYRWKLRYTLLSFCIRHGFVIRKVPSDWAYDACFIYDETDSSVSEWVEALVLKLETDLRLRLYEAERDAPVGANILDEAASAIDKSRHAVLVLSRGFLENRLNMYSAQWSNESLFMRRRSLAVLVMRERLSESDLRLPGCKVLHRLYRMCKPTRVVDCSGFGIGSNSANRLGLLLYRGASPSKEGRPEDSETESTGAAETEPLLSSA